MTRLAALVVMVIFALVLLFAHRARARASANREGVLQDETFIGGEPPTTKPPPENDTRTPA
jgi:uncharacterized membrane protein YphA (DoxX/SURF4 family)